MAAVIELTMLPAQDGDSLLLAYGEGSSPVRKHRMLIDGGRASSYPLFAALVAPEPIEVLVVTHVDQDHVLGVLALVNDPARPALGDVWFNGYDHLVGDGLEHFGPRDGELLTSALDRQGLAWNASFDGRTVLAGRRAELAGGAAVTVLSPDRGQLDRLRPFWEKECARHGLIPGREATPPQLPGFESLGAAAGIEELAASRFVPDSSLTNASSIGFLFEYEGRRLVFTGDGDDGRLARSLQPLAESEGGRLRIDALKVAHHGSAANLSKELLALLDCPSYLISTSGARHHHPDDECMARILKFGGPAKDIVFNYRDRAAKWQDAALQEQYGYRVLSPATSDGFITLMW